MTGAMREGHGREAVAAERPLLLPCSGERLLGVLHPAGGTLGVVMVVGGPQYRAGSHRHFVRWARSLAATGCPVLRFDTRGMGDSSGTLHSFEHIGPDIEAAIDALMQAQPHVDRVVLWGLCDAASAALLYLHDRPDPRVAGLCLLNPWARSEQTQARTQVKHYYRQRLMQPGFWRKLLSGQVAAGAVAGLWRALRTARTAASGSNGGPGDDNATTDYVSRMLAGWQTFGGPIWLLLSGRDYTAKEFLALAETDPRWARAVASPGVTRLDLKQADHTLADHPSMRAAEVGMLAWIASAVMPERTRAVVEASR